MNKRGINMTWTSSGKYSKEIDGHIVGCKGYVSKEKFINAGVSLYSKVRYILPKGFEMTFKGYQAVSDLYMFEVKIKDNTYTYAFRSQEFTWTQEELALTPTELKTSKNLLTGVITDIPEDIYYDSKLIKELIE